MTRRILGYAFVLATGLSLLGPSMVQATSSSKLELGVLPIQCQLSTVDTGTGQSQSLTPDDCGGPPVQQPGGDKPIATPLPDDTPALPDSIIQQPTPTPTVPKPAAREEGSSLPQNPVTQLAQLMGFQNIANNPSAAAGFSATAASATGAMGLAADAALFQGRGRKYMMQRARSARLRRRGL